MCLHTRYNESCYLRRSSINIADHASVLSFVGLPDISHGQRQDSITLRDLVSSTVHDEIPAMVPLDVHRGVTVEATIELGGVPNADINVIEGADNPRSARSVFH